MPTCSAEGCSKEAQVEVILYDVYVHHIGAPEPIFFQRDFTCPFLCYDHAVENEEQADGERRPRGTIRYPYSNRHGAQGFTIYRPLS